MSVLLTTLIIVATLGTIAALVMGLWSMVYGHGESGPYDEEHWMTYRVILQAIAVAALVATFFVGS